MTRLQRAADAAGVPVLTDALVCELWVGEDGALTGLGYHRPDGTLERLRCEVLREGVERPVAGERERRRGKPQNSSGKRR